MYTPCLTDELTSQLTHNMQFEQETVTDASRVTYVDSWAQFILYLITHEQQRLDEWYAQDFFMFKMSVGMSESQNCISTLKNQVVVMTQQHVVLNMYQ